ncbi:hypothetical protein CCACVL1_09483 [Corchorus capsularis]|uniref:Transmembrane protein n=1 Tax=Corchorus capsularis TaxID=210143 RepID=A0A1R3IVW8_COCAP|nr:hypothetical protein CCACVL1_09483 [Corchorus capsularis]
MDVDETPPPPQTPPSPPCNDNESQQDQSPSAAPTWTIPANLKVQLEATAAAQEHGQWRNVVVTFCISYALQMIQFMGNADHDSNHHSLVVALSVIVLVVFTLLLVALFVHQSSSRVSQVLEKVAFLLSAAAFCLSLSIPFSFELRCAVWAVFLLALLIIIIFIMCLNPNTPQP